MNNAILEGVIFGSLLVCALGVCTPRFDDPWRSGSHVGCCPGTTSTLNNWDGDSNWYYLCIPEPNHAITYRLSPTANNVCPPDYEGLYYEHDGSEAECRYACESVGETYGGRDTINDRPRGCFLVPNNGNPRCFMNNLNPGIAIHERFPICRACADGYEKQGDNQNRCVPRPSPTHPLTPPPANKDYKTPGLPLVPLTEHRSHNGELRVHIELDTLHYDGPNGYSLMTRALNGEIPGPTIRAKRGDTVYVKWCNKLDGLIPGNHGHNQFGDPNVTNMHTHGLHISPKEPSDNVFVQVHPGNAPPPSSPPTFFCFCCYLFAAPLLILALNLTPTLTPQDSVMITSLKFPCGTKGERTGIIHTITRPPVYKWEGERMASSSWTTSPVICLSLLPTSKKCPSSCPTCSLIFTDKSPAPQGMHFIATVHTEISSP